MTTAVTTYWVSHSAMSGGQSHSTHLSSRRGFTRCGRSTIGWAKVQILGSSVCANCERSVGASFVESILAQEISARSANP
jgi:hypothetical protein